MTTAATRKPRLVEDPYVLDEQVGFVMRQASQRHTSIFASHMPGELTPTQWAALAKLAEVGPCSQNLLGRHTAMDAATIKGVVDRLIRRGLTTGTAYPGDGRRVLITLTAEGWKAFERARPFAEQISLDTLEPFTTDERQTFMNLLLKLV